METMLHNEKIFSVTKSQLDSLISNLDLVKGAVYIITDRGDRGISLKANSNKSLSLKGERVMLCPKSYTVGALDGNAWKGVWRNSKSAAINDLMIRGGKVWKNLTGNIGTATSDIALDVVNWVLISKSSFSNNEYVEKIFDISYDYENDWISQQEDNKGNVFGINFYEFPTSYLEENPVDSSDWNSNDMYNNKVVGIWNNIEGTIINNNQGRWYIANNMSVEISSNWCSSAYVGFIDANTSDTIISNRCELIFGNSGNILNNFIFSGSIGVNTSDVLFNVAHYSIYNNTTSAIIGNNIYGIDFSTNSIANNTVEVSYNSGGYIEGNSGTSGKITNNRILGTISGNNLSTFNIQNNTNNGSITFGTLVANIEDTIVNK